jgi:SAM-dependent methyltransferase
MRERHEALADACPLCGGQDATTLTERDRAGQPLTVVLCLGCGMGRVRPMPSAKGLLQYYQSHYRPEYKSRREPAFHHVLRGARTAVWRLRRLRGLLRPGACVLDAGCGSGEFLYLLRATGCKVAGIDPDDGYRGYVERELGLTVYAGGLHEQTFPPATFDVITAPCARAPSAARGESPSPRRLVASGGMARGGGSQPRVESGTSGAPVSPGARDLFQQHRTEVRRRTSRTDRRFSRDLPGWGQPMGGIPPGSTRLPGDRPGSRGSVGGSGAGVFGTLLLPVPPHVGPHAAASVADGRGTAHGAAISFAARDPRFLLRFQGNRPRGGCRCQRAASVTGAGCKHWLAAHSPVTRGAGTCTIKNPG